MTKYYKVYFETKDKIFFEHNEGKEFYAVCKKIPFSNTIFKEIITNKTVYPIQEREIRGLTYGFLQNGIPRTYKMSIAEVKVWLSNLNKKKIKEYINKLNEIEKISIQYCKNESQKTLEVIKDEIIDRRSIKVNIRILKLK